MRAPKWASDAKIGRFVESHRGWIEKRQQKVAEEAAVAEAEPISPEEMKRLIAEGKKVFAERCAYYAPIVGVSFNCITVRAQKTRWGSCSSKGNLNFNALLMLAPREVLDATVVHELCHRLVPNHSKKFYREVLRVYPAYRKWDKWLKDNGDTLMRRREAGDRESGEPRLRKNG